MTPAELNAGPITEALKLLPPQMDSVEARLMLLAIAQQESGPALTDRKQVGGPARGLWQFEMGGGVYGVLTNSLTSAFASAICNALGVFISLNPIYDALAENDVLAAAFARLLLWTDPAPLPEVGRATEAWDYYRRNWRPGRPHFALWPGNYQRAREALAV